MKILYIEDKLYLSIKLLNRVTELRDEYFNKLDDLELHRFYKGLDVCKKYTSDELITLLCVYEDKLYPEKA